MLALNSLAAHAQATAVYSWVKTTKSAAELLQGPDMCAGIDTNPTTWKGFTAIAVGPCTSEMTSGGELVGPPVYIEQDLVDLIFVNGADAYLTDEANKLQAVDPTASASNGYRDFAANQEAGTGNKCKSRGKRRRSWAPQWAPPHNHALRPSPFPHSSTSRRRVRPERRLLRR